MGSAKRVAARLWPCRNRALRDRAPGAVVKAFDATALRTNRAIAANDDEAAIRLISCGAPMPGQHVRIVDPETRALLPDSSAGEIWLAGCSLADWRLGRCRAHRGAVSRTLAGDKDGEPHLRTGDCGFRHDGELFVTGRLKDLIVVHGKNHAPDDVEQTIQSVHPALRTGCGAVVQTAEHERARLIAIQEVLRVADLDHHALFAGINRAMTERHGLTLDAIELIRAGSLPRTRNGKICRRACLAAFNEGSLRRVDGWRRPAGNAAPGSAPAVQARLLARLHEMLPGRAIAAEQNLFELGVDLLAIHALLAWLQDSFGVELPFEAVFEAPTVARLAARVSERQPAGNAGSALTSPAKRGSNGWADVSPADVLQELRKLGALVAEQTRLLSLLRLARRRRRR